MSDDTTRRLSSIVAAHSRWAMEQDRSAATAPGRAAFMARFEKQVDPDGRLDPTERARRADSARKAYFAGLALKSAKARRTRQQADRLDAEIDAAVAEIDVA